MSKHPRSGHQDGIPPNDRTSGASGERGQPTRSQDDRVVNDAGHARPAGEPGHSAGPAENAGDKDINPIIHDWNYEPGTINVRKIAGIDGRPKLQMRLDLGLIQMELTGRPDGRQPHGYESLLEYHEKRLTDHEKRHGTDLGFTISGGGCQLLREEAVMYYQRYLSLFVLEDFSGVVRDAARNLRVLDLCNKFAADEDDRLAMEQYRPYIMMMHARAQASIHFREKRYRDALIEIDNGLAEIRGFFEHYGQPEAFGRANEVKVLKRFAREIRRELPVDPIKRYQKKLDRAVKEERYEEAAKLRDRLATMKGEPQGPRSARQQNSQQSS